MTDHALNLSITGLTSAFERGQLDPVAVLDRLAEEVRSDKREVNAFCHIDLDQARDQAEASAQRWRSGRPLSVLDGVPVSIKDLTDVAGWPTRRGSLSTNSTPAPKDALLVTFLREAGAVLFAKTTTTEFGWTTASSNPHTGTTRNPRDLSRSAGGSSSGAAAQVAAGWGPLAIGSDAGGSVRIPASYCGVVGFKPTFGAIPLAPQSAFAEFAHIGPLARSVEDCQIAMRVVGQPSNRDPSSLFSRSTRTRPSRLRIGWTLQLGSHTELQPEIKAQFLSMLTRLESEGVELVAVSSEGMDKADAMWTVWQSRVYESFLTWTEDLRSKLAPGLQSVWEEGSNIQAQQLAHARVELRALADLLAQRFCDVDLLLTPATPTVAPLLPAQPDETAQNWFSLNGYAYPFNLTQQPALSVPLGHDANGLPFNVQIVGRRFDDELVLSFGRDIEALLSGRAPWTSQ